MCWLALAALCLSLLIHLAIYLIDHRSTSFIVLTVVVSAAALGGMPAATWIAFRLTPAMHAKLRERAHRWRSVYLVQQPIYNADYLTSRGYEVVAEIPGERYSVLIYEKGAEND